MLRCKHLNIKNFPDKANNLANISFFEKLDNLVDCYKFTEHDGIFSINVSLIFNQQVSLQNSITKNNNIFLYHVNLPKLSSEQDLEFYKFRANLDKLLKEVNFNKDDGIDYANIVVTYNKQNIDDSMTTELYNDNQKTDTKSDESESFFLSVLPKYKLEQVVLNDAIKDEINKLFTFLDTRHIIYEEWGFNEIDPEPKAILNFYGAPGTGKTMTAHAIAHKMGSKILALNYADIESKYVGDAPKNLVKAFDSAKKDQSVLFFDEADSFLGKRIENVSSSSDQAVNSLRSQLLILLENFNGIVIFATNLINNYDKAFESRILKHIHFTLPDQKLRVEMINKSIPEKVPFENNKRLSEDQLTYLAEVTDGFSGREIKNTVLESLTHAIPKKIACFDDFKITFDLAKINRSKLNTATKGESQNSSLEDKIKDHLASMRRKSRNLKEQRRF